MSYFGRVATGASEDRLEKLIEKRLKPGGEVLRIGDHDVFGSEAAHRLRYPLRPPRLAGR